MLKGKRKHRHAGVAIRELEETRAQFARDAFEARLLDPREPYLTQLRELVVVCASDLGDVECLQRPNFSDTSRGKRLTTYLVQAHRMLRVAEDRVPVVGKYLELRVICT